MSSRPHRWLTLAARARQWALDAQGSLLQRARHAEVQAQDLRDGHVQALDAAHAGRSELLRRGSFGAADLARQAQFEQRLRGQAAQSEAALQQAREAADALRGEMQLTLAERDAYRHRSDQLRQRHQQDRARAAVRELDESWLARMASNDGGGREN